MAFSLVRNDPDNEAIGALWRYYRSWLDKEYPEAVLVSEWSDPAVAIPAGFHIDFLIQIGQPAYGILLGPLSWPNGYSRDPHAFFERAGGGDIKPFVENYLRTTPLRSLAVTFQCRRPITISRVRPVDGTNKRFVPFLRCY